MLKTEISLARHANGNSPFQLQENRKDFRSIFVIDALEYTP